MNQNTFTMLKIQFGYFIFTILLFGIEVIIGTCFHNAIIRPFGGDFLVVILVYCFGKSFVDTPLIATVIGVLLFAYIVELSQYFHLINIVGLQNSRAAQLIMGTSFCWTDMMMYILGMLLVWIIETLFNHRPSKFKEQA